MITQSEKRKTKNEKPKTKHILFCCLLPVACCLLTLLTGWSQEKPKDVLIFPFGLAETVKPPEDFNLAVEATNALYAQLQKMKGVSVQRFKLSHPSVQRAISEQRLRRDRLQPPYNVKEPDGTWLAVKIGREAAATYVLAGSIDEYTYDANTKQVTLTLSLDMMQVKDNEVLTSAAETGRARAGTEDVNQNALTVQAIQDAMQKISASLAPRLAPMIEQPFMEKKPRKGGAGVFAVIGLGILIGLRLAFQQD